MPLGIQAQSKGCAFVSVCSSLWMLEDPNVADPSQSFDFAKSMMFLDYCFFLFFLFFFWALSTPEFPPDIVLVSDRDSTLANMSYKVVS
jgi:hypothetical protein